MNYPHVGSLLFNTPLMIAPDKLQAILAGVGQRFFADLSPEALRQLFSAPPAASADEDPPVRRRHRLYTDGAIGILPISGSLTHRTLGMEALSGLQSYAEIEEDLMDAATDPAIAGILLDVNSPGGESEGLFDLMDLVKQAAEMKPLYAIANESAFSAAYALVAPAAQIFVPRTGGVGSVGVIAVHVDESQAHADAGLTTTVFRGGKFKAEHNSLEPLTEHAMSSLQQEVDRRYELFTAAVAQVRPGLSLAQVKATEAQTYFGPDAVRLGLADQLGTFKDAFHALQARVTGNALQTTVTYNHTMPSTPSTETITPSERGTAAPYPPKEDSMNPEDTNAAVPSTADAQVIDLEQATQAGTRAEKERVLKITNICKLAGCMDRLADFLTSDLSPESITEQLLTAQAEADEAIALSAAPPQGVPSLKDAQKAVINTAEIYRRRNAENAIYKR